MAQQRGCLIPGAGRPSGRNRCLGEQVAIGVCLLGVDWTAVSSAQMGPGAGHGPDTLPREQLLRGLELGRGRESGRTAPSHLTPALGQVLARIRPRAGSELKSRCIWLLPLISGSPGPGPSAMEHGVHWSPWYLHGSFPTCPFCPACPLAYGS